MDTNTLNAQRRAAMAESRERMAQQTERRAATQTDPKLKARLLEMAAATRRGDWRALGLGR